MKQLPLRFHPAILLLALLATGLTYAWRSYSPLSLVLIQRTATAGVGKVYWDSGNGYSEKQCTEFAVNQGENGHPGKPVQKPLLFLFCLLSSLGNWSPTPYREERIL